MDIDQLFQLINDDLAGEDADDQLFFRYLTLANRRNAGLCGPDLDVERAAMVKTLNSVSLSALIEPPFAVDPLGLVYRIDLRDYEWDRAVTVNGAAYNDVWEALAENVYSVPWQGDDIDDVVADTGTAVPVMFASTFVAQATDVSNYYALLGIPENVDGFILDELGIDVAQNFADDEVIRAGFAGTAMDLPDDAFIAERHDIEVRNGYLWQVSSFGGTPGDLFANPLSQPAGEREIIFTLKNGLLAFVFVDDSGNRLNTSGAFSASNPALQVRDSFGRHASGIRASDQVRDAADLGMLGHLTIDELEKLRVIYPAADDLTRILDDDRGQYAFSLAAAELDIERTEPITRTYATYVADVDLNVAAGDLMTTPEQLRADLVQLVPRMQALGNGGISRNDFALYYRRSLCVLTVAHENTPDAALCARFLSGP
jgi:hypothetical protein